jgi:hypothetical protein
MKPKAARPSVWQSVADDQLTEVLVVREEDAVLAGGTFKHVGVRRTRSEVRRPGHVESVAPEAVDDRANDVS